MNRPRILEGCDVLPPMTPEPSAATKPPKGKRKTAKGRFRVLNTFVDASMRQLDGSAVKVWLILYRDTKTDGTASTGQTDIARRAGVSVRTVCRAIRQLEGCGLLTVIRRGRLGKGPSVYRVRPLQLDDAL